MLLLGLFRLLDWRLFNMLWLWRLLWLVVLFNCGVWHCRNDLLWRRGDGGP